MGRKGGRKEEARERKREGKETVRDLTFTHFPNACNSQCWVRLTAGA